MRFGVQGRPLGHAKASLPEMLKIFSPRRLAAPPTGRRLVFLIVGLILFGISIGLIVLADLGADPWTVFHQGLANHIPLTLGQTTVAVSFAVLVLWIPLKEKPGLGTIGNAIVVGLMVDLTLAVLPKIDQMGLRIGSLILGIIGTGIASGLYIGAGLGPGPRDGLMTGFSRFGWPIRRIRTSIEAVALITGWLLGGSVGFGTLAFALFIGPIVHVTLPRFTIATID